jgi:PAS domain S-box-containing protein
MLWLYLLGILTLLAIVMRRLLRRLKPLNDEVYSWRVAIDHVNSGVAWIPASGRLHSVNPALAKMLGATAEELAGRNWLGVFAESDRPRVEQVYSQMLLARAASINAATVDAWGIETPHDVRLVAVYDHKMRLMGHHCIIEPVSEKGRQASRLESVRRIRENLEAARPKVSRAQFATLSS